MTAAEEIRVLSEVVRRFLSVCADWHDSMPALQPRRGLASTAISLHAANFGLWHCEDQARRTQSSDAQVAKFKRLIDRLNLQRNKIIEEVDRLLLGHLQASDEVAFCSDTPGMIVDRLSVLVLRKYHTARRVRNEPDDPSREQQLQVIELQTHDLTLALDTLLDDLIAGRKRFRVYQQFKGITPEYCPSSEGIESLVPRLTAYETER
jgi:hypothetical protein